MNSEWKIEWDSPTEFKLARMLAIAEVALKHIYNEAGPRDKWTIQEYETAMRHDEHEADFALTEIEKIKKGFQPVKKESK